MLLFLFSILYNGRYDPLTNVNFYPIFPGHTEVLELYLPYPVGWKHGMPIVRKRNEMKRTSIRQHWHCYQFDGNMWSCLHKVLLTCCQKKGARNQTLVQYICSSKKTRKRHCFWSKRISLSLLFCWASLSKILFVSLFRLWGLYWRIFPASAKEACGMMVYFLFAKS